MPGFNRQGPNNEGPKTGRSMGQCGNKNADNPITNGNSEDSKGGVIESLLPFWGRRKQGRQGGQRGQGGQSNGRGFGRGRGRCQ